MPCGSDQKFVTRVATEAEMRLGDARLRIAFLGMLAIGGTLGAQTVRFEQYERWFRAIEFERPKGLAPWQFPPSEAFAKCFAEIDMGARTTRVVEANAK